MSLAPKVGDDCESCAFVWDGKKMPRKKLVQIASTQNKGMMVLVCPFCDGERAIELSRDRNS